MQKLRDTAIAAGFAVAVATGGAAPVVASPVIATYTSEAAFVAAHPTAVLETFSTEIAPGRNDVPTTYDFGFFSIEKQYGGGNHGSAGGFWQGRPTTALSDVIKFDRGLMAWGADFNTQVGGNGDGVQLSITVVVDFISKGVVIGTVGAGTNPNNQFLGFMTDTAFDTVRITAVGSSDTYQLDNMRYAVPEPASLALLGAGLLGLGALRRRRATA